MTASDFRQFMRSSPDPLCRRGCGTVGSQLFASRRGSYQLARAWADYPGETGHYVHGVFAEADFGPTEQPAESDRGFLWKLFMKSRGSYSLESAEGKAIQEVKEVDPEWHPKEPRPFVVFAEWRLPIKEDLHSKDYYYRFHFPMQTRADLILDAIPMGGADRGKFLVVKARPPNRF
ncbi:hypothetical protein NPIL_336951 [Nephila pilipes]|uniref:Uncharacterized protein n=1 Tax=Nephila pilipes TaxID=299642 RepID=A0A8X6NWV2_NEPPI|nr:hypothetical protein NPIL_336951 [Nephila pilipes]